MRCADAPEPPKVVPPPLPLTSWWAVPREQFGQAAKTQQGSIPRRTPKREREAVWGDEMARLSALEREQKRGSGW